MKASIIGALGATASYPAGRPTQIDIRFDSGQKVVLDCLPTELLRGLSEESEKIKLPRLPLGARFKTHLSRVVYKIAKAIIS